MTMNRRATFSLRQETPAGLADRLLVDGRRVLLVGAPGVGKSTLAGQLAEALFQAGRPCTCISADPGSPAFGVPGALCLGTWLDDGWTTVAIEALCTLDAGRFRLPLTDALRRLIERVPPGVLLIDGPGVVRGVAGAELLMGITAAAEVDTVVAILRTVHSLPLAQELSATGAAVYAIQANPGACRPGKRRRARWRTRLWDAYLERAAEQSIPLAQVHLLGTPPPIAASEAWIGRQVALLDSAQCTRALGEVVGIEDQTVVVRMPTVLCQEGLLLLRDAKRTRDGLLNTATGDPSGASWYMPPPDLLARCNVREAGGPRPVVRVGSVTAALANGVFGDPLLHLRMQHQKRSLLFDLGEASRLPARIAHQVSEVLVSHAHFDHIAGFLWLLRARIGILRPCRVYGPPGLTQNIQGLVNGIHWDRIGDRGPSFEVNELHGKRLLRFNVQAGYSTPKPLDERLAATGVVLEEPEFRVRAVTLDHGTPVLAYAFEPSSTLNIRKDQLVELGLPVGAWLGELKRRMTARDWEALIELPDGRRERTAWLADQLVIVSRGKRLVYATDLADTPDNRQRLVALAAGAHTLFCEATFVQADKSQAINTGHLTARACGEIATAAGVERLVPFHFSRRYEDDPTPVYDEVRAACPRALAPPWRAWN
jgi:ribonuclease BN (tRNA processing enzyme)